jgi:hypothetical protein
MSVPVEICILSYCQIEIKLSIKYITKKIAHNHSVIILAFQDL